MSQGSADDVVEKSGSPAVTDDAFTTWFDPAAPRANDAMSPEEIGAFALIDPADQPSPAASDSLHSVPLIASAPTAPAKAHDSQKDEDALVIIPHPQAARDLARQAVPDPASFIPAKPKAALVEPTSRGSAFTIPLLCLGMALIAACLLIPLADENRQLMWEREQLKLDLEQVNRQVSVNDEFLKRVDDDPTLAERLAQREMKTVRANAAVLNVSDGTSKHAGSNQADMSPFLLVNVPAPARLAAYQPIGGVLSRFCRDSQTRGYTLGLGMLLVAAGLVLGYSKPERP